MKRREFIAAMGATVAWQPASRAQQPPASELAPQGKLRVGLLGYNPVLLTRKADGAIDGVSVRLGQFIAEKLGVAFEPVVYTTPQAGVDPKGKAPAAISKLSEIVDLAKSSGLVQKAIDDAGLKAVHVPPI